MSETIIDRIYQDNLNLLNYLNEKKEISFASQFALTFTKTLLLAIASYFEDEICKLVLAFVEQKTRNNQCITSLIKNKVINRQYHTYFDWKGKNANQFLGLFGDDFKKDLAGKIAKDSSLETSVKAFLELGNIRNCLVHQNFASYTIDKTPEEIYHLYKKAILFLDFLLINFKND